MQCKSQYKMNARGYCLLGPYASVDTQDPQRAPYVLPVTLVTRACQATTCSVCLTNKVSRRSSSGARWAILAQSPTWSGLTPTKTDLLIHSTSSRDNSSEHAVATTRTAFIYRHSPANRSALFQDIDKALPAYLVTPSCGRGSSAALLDSYERESACDKVRDTVSSKVSSSPVNSE